MMTTRLRLHIGHKKDVFFAVKNVLKEHKSSYLIFKIFYDNDECLEYIENFNRLKGTE